MAYNMATATSRQCSTQPEKRPQPGPLLCARNSQKASRSLPPRKDLLNHAKCRKAIPIPSPAISSISRLNTLDRHHCLISLSRLMLRLLVLFSVAFPVAMGRLFRLRGRIMARRICAAWRTISNECYGLMFLGNTGSGPRLGGARAASVVSNWGQRGVFGCLIRARLVTGRQSSCSASTAVGSDAGRAGARGRVDGRRDGFDELRST